MPDILHDFPINAPIGRVFEAISTPGGLDPWWTKRSAGFLLREEGGTTRVRFYHADWPDPGEHFRTSTFCWMYLRILRRYLETGERVPYERRLEV